ncbi:unnamed protein product [Closterium sp. NIES-53]
MSSPRHLRLVIISASVHSWVFLLCFALLDWSSPPIPPIPPAPPVPPAVVVSRQGVLQILLPPGYSAFDAFLSEPERSGSEGCSSAPEPRWGAPADCPLDESATGADDDVEFWVADGLPEHLPIPSFPPPNKKRPHPSRDNGDARPPSPRHKPTKHRRNSYTSHEKLQWILKLEAGEMSVQRMSREYVISRRCLTWKNRKGELEGAHGARCRLHGRGRSSWYLDMEAEVYLRFLAHSKKCLAVSIARLQKWSHEVESTVAPLLLNPRYAAAVAVAFRGVLLPLLRAATARWQQGRRGTGEGLREKGKEEHGQQAQEEEEEQDQGVPCQGREGEKGDSEGADGMEWEGEAGEGKRASEGRWRRKMKAGGKRGTQAEGQGSREDEEEEGEGRGERRVEEYETVCEALSIVLAIAPHSVNHLRPFFAAHPPPFLRLLLCDFNEGASAEDPSALLPPLRTSLRLLLTSLPTFASLWDWSPLFPLLLPTSSSPHQHTRSDEPEEASNNGGRKEEAGRRGEEEWEEVRWVVLEIVSLVLSFDEATRTRVGSALCALTATHRAHFHFRWRQLATHVEAERAPMFLLSPLHSASLQATISDADASATPGTDPSGASAPSPLSPLHAPVLTTSGAGFSFDGGGGGEGEAASGGGGGGAGVLTASSTSRFNTVAVLGVDLPQRPPTLLPPLLSRSSPPLNLTLSFPSSPCPPYSCALLFSCTSPVCILIPPSSMRSSPHTPLLPHPPSSPSPPPYQPAYPSPSHALLTPHPSACVTSPALVLRLPPSCPLFFSCTYPSRPPPPFPVPLQLTPPSRPLLSPLFPTEAAARGLWVLLENISGAPFDLLSSLLPLLQDRCLHLPGHSQPLQAADGFQIFATKAVAASSSLRSSAASGVDSLLASHFHTVHIHPPHASELPTILTSSFPSLSALVPTLLGMSPLSSFFVCFCFLIYCSVFVSIFSILYTDPPRFAAPFSRLPHLPPPAPPLYCPNYHHFLRSDLVEAVGRVASGVPLSSSLLQHHQHQQQLIAAVAEAAASGGISVRYSRQVSLRDTMKIALRLHSLPLPASIPTQPTPTLVLPLTVRERIYFEVVDCLVACVASPEQRCALMAHLALLCGLPTDYALQLHSLYQPTVHASSLELRVGRAVVPLRLHQANDSSEGNSMAFAATGAVLRLMERVAVCVGQREPVLLVGETGTGKTTTVQHLARMAGRGLSVINMSQHSDSADFLGGFKPVEQRVVCLALYHSFTSLFSNTFPSQVPSHCTPLLCHALTPSLPFHPPSPPRSVLLRMCGTSSSPRFPPLPPPHHLLPPHQRNAEFLLRLSRLAAKGKWPLLLSAFRSTALKVAHLLAPAPHTDARAPASTTAHAPAAAAGTAGAAGADSDGGGATGSGSGDAGGGSESGKPERSAKRTKRLDGEVCVCVCARACARVCEWKEEEGRRVML